ncbi:hypothetical protein RIF29_14502 [Crotalaria pallida]|uniref:Uncharacterized protein n=1 Tax=Crotalaria pallida TaxID=3830 RepID=A0AAN9FBP6_CROPI
MARKKGRPPKSPSTHLSSPSNTIPKNLDLENLDEDDIEDIDALSPKKAASILEKLGALRAKIKGKAVIVEEEEGINNEVSNKKTPIRQAPGPDGLGGSYTHLSKLHPAIDHEMEVVLWDEGCMDSEENRVTHSTRQKPCCCSNYDSDYTRNLKVPAKFVAKGSRGHCSSIPDRHAHVASECSDDSLNDEITDKPSSSDQSEPEYGYRNMHHMKYF